MRSFGRYSLLFFLACIALSTAFSAYSTAAKKDYVEPTTGIRVLFQLEDIHHFFLHGQTLYVDIKGKSFAALDLHTLEPIWEYKEKIIMAWGPMTADEEAVFYRWVCNGLHLSSFDRRDGRKIWQYEKRYNYIVPCHGSSICLYGEKICFEGPDGVLLALSRRTGELKWEYLRKHNSFTRGPILYDNRLLIVASSYTNYNDLPVAWSINHDPSAIYALDPETGKEIWMSPSADWVGAMSVQGDQVLYGESGVWDHALQALSAENGQETWRFKTEGAVESITVENGTAYFGGTDNTLYALDLGTLKEKWRCKTGGGIEGNPVVHGGVVYFGAEDRYLYAVESETGRQIWRFPTKGIPCRFIFSSVLKKPLTRLDPVVKDGVLYLIDSKGTLYALELPKTVS